MIRSYLSGWQNYTNTSKRTNRKTFWAFVFIDLLILIFTLPIIISIDSSNVENYNWFHVSLQILWVVYIVGAIPPRLSICARRIKDTGKSTNWMLFLFVPIIGWLILLMIFIQESIAVGERTLETNIQKKLITNESSKGQISNDIESKIDELNRLKEKGIISDEEYEKMRKKTLGL